MTGVFEQAHGGTLFLDEIGDSLLSFQIKLLRVLQEKQVRRIGDDKLIPVDVRVIVATNKDIAQLVRERSFREDLYYRLNVLPLHLLPLRERRADILPLAREFYREMASSLPKLSLFDVFFAGKLDELMQYDFPGNARQLRNVVEFLVCTSENGLCPDISPAFGEVVPSRPRPLQDEQIVLEALREHADELPLDDFSAHMKGRETEYEQLLVYFLYRHVPTALDDGDVSSKAAFAVLSVRLLFSLGALHLLLHGEFTVEDQIELCRLYSAEVEYSDDHMDALFDALL